VRTPRHLGGKLRELRFHLGPTQQRITYWLAPGKRIVLLTGTVPTIPLLRRLARALDAELTIDLTPRNAA
jgi:hypothetical protein